MPLFAHSRLLSQTLVQQLSGLRRYSNKAADLYEVLGVQRTCPQALIKLAFYRKAKQMHPDLQQGAEADGDGREFIRLAAAYEVLRDPNRRATYDAHLSSRSKIVKSAFDFDPKAPPASESSWQDEPIGDSHVAPWIWQYRQAVKEVVRYGGDGEGLAHLVKAEFGAVVRKAYFGPEVEDLPFGEWPMEFEGEERSVAGVGDIMHLVSGRQLLGTVREAQDILLGQGADLSGRPIIEAGRGEVRIEASTESRNSSTSSGENTESDWFGKATEIGSREAKFRVSVNRKMDGLKTGGAGGKDGLEPETPPRSPNTTAKNGAKLSVSGFQDASQRPGQANGTESGTRDRNGTFGGWTKASEERSRGGSLGEDKRSGQRAFATLELAQNGDVLAVATREWVPLGESGNGTESGRRGVEEAECIDCISVYAVNRGIGADEESNGLWGEKREWGRASDAPEEDQESDGTGNGSGSGSRGGNRNGNGSGIGEGSGNGRGNGDGNGIGMERGEQVSRRGFESNGWAEDIENLGMRYKRPRLLARIFGLKEEGVSIDVFHEGDVKTHTLLQHRTPLVRHVTWYRSDVDKQGRRIRKCEARLRRAAMLPSSLWLFEPRTNTHDCGGWYFERFDEEQPRGGSPFARLQPDASQDGLTYIESKQGTDSRSGRNPSFAHRDSYLAGSQKHFSSEKGRWDPSDGTNRCDHNHLRFEWPSNKVKEGLETADANSRTAAQARYAKPLDPAVYILTAAYLTLEKEEGTRKMRASTIANLLEKGAKWTGDLRSWWQKTAGV